MNISVPSAVVLGADVFDRFLDENGLRDFAIETDDDAAIRRRFHAAAFPEETAQDLDALLKARSLPARRALLEPAGGLAVPALRRRLRDVHAAEQPRQPRHPALPAPGGDQEGLCLHVLAPREGLPRRHALPPRGGEDGRRPPADRGSLARRSLLPGHLGRGAVAQFLSLAAHPDGGRHRGRRPRLRGKRRGRRGLREVLPEISPPPRAVLVRRGHPPEFAAGVLRPGPSQTPRRGPLSTSSCSSATASRPPKRTGRWLRWAPRTPRRTRPSTTAFRARASASSRSLRSSSTRRSRWPRFWPLCFRSRRAERARRWRSSSRSTSWARGALRRSSASCSSALWPSRGS